MIKLHQLKEHLEHPKPSTLGIVFLSTSIVVLSHCGGSSEPVHKPPGKTAKPRHKVVVLLVALVILGLSFIPLSQIKSEFMPPLDEGDLLFMPVLLPGASLTQVMEIMKKQDVILMSFPEVEQVVGKLGRAETPTDPAPVGMIETIVKLKPQDMWREGLTRQQLINEMDNALKIPGSILTFSPLELK